MSTPNTITPKFARFALMASLERVAHECHGQNCTSLSDRLAAAQAKIDFVRKELAKGSIPRDAASKSAVHHVWLERELAPVIGDSA